MTASRFDPALIRRAILAANGGAPPSAPDASAPPPRQFDEPAGDDAIQIAAALCRRFEGLYLRPYLCPAGVATIGYGSTAWPDGRPVRLTDPPITEAQAEAMLLHDLRTVRLPAVRRLCPGADRPGRLAALLDFAFNLGAGALAASTLRREVNAGRWDAVPGQLRRWVMAGGRRLRGLVLRREAEVRLI